MNIQQYYRKTADISLNGSLAALVPPSFFLLYSILSAQRVNPLLIAVPFIVYSFLCFQMFLLNKQRADDIENTRCNYFGTGAMRFLLQSDALIAYMPAPSLRMIIFNPQGMQIGEIRDVNMWKIRWFMPYFLDRLFPKKLGIFNDADAVEAEIIIRKAKIEIFDGNTQEKETISFKKKGSNLIYKHRNGQYYIPRSYFHTDLQVYKGADTRIARFRKGWMPLDWAHRFKDPNTPILSFEAGVTAEEKIRIYAIFASLFHYRNH